MSVRKIFWDDPYQAELKTSVTGYSGNVVTLKETIPFTFSGGQQSDDGTINDFKKSKVQKSGKEIFYTIEQGHNLKSVDIVLLKIYLA